MPLSKLEQRLIEIETDITTLKEESFAHVIVIAWLLHKIANSQPITLEDVRKFLIDQQLEIADTYPLCSDSLDFLLDFVDAYDAF